MKCADVIEQIEQHSPAAVALEWDNVGLLAGRRDKEVHTIMLALDATTPVIDQAIEAGADMLLTHHPLIYRPLSGITTDDMVGRRIVRLIQHDISYYAMHTSFDVRGMAQLSEEKLQLSDTRVLEITGQDAEGKPEGIGRVGCLPRPMTLKELAAYVKQQFHLEKVRVCGKMEAVIERAAVSGGSGKSMVKPALEAGAQVLISGDLDHHTVLDALEQGLFLIDAGHYGTEHMFCEYMKQYLQSRTSGLDIKIAVEQDPYSII